MQRRTRTRSVLAVLAAAAAALVLVPTGSTAAPAPAPTGARTDAAPPGANDWDCVPRRGDQPVVLVNGTFETDEKNWVTVSPLLVARGYCVFTFDYGETNGIPATGPIGKSAEELRAFVARVLRATHQDRVDLVGHSQGGMMPRYYLRFLNGNLRVDDLVGIAPSNHGTTLPMLPPGQGPSMCKACEQQAAGSDFLTRLNRGGDVVGGVDYTVISTRYDEVVTPWQSQRLTGAPARITNTLVQAVCPTDVFEHDQLPNDPVTQRIVLDALKVDGPAREDLRPACGPITP